MSSLMLTMKLLIWTTVLPLVSDSSEVLSPTPTNATTTDCIAYKNDTIHDEGAGMFILPSYADLNETATKYVTTDTINFINQNLNCSSSDCLVECNHHSFCGKATMDIHNVANNKIIILCMAEHSCSSASIITSEHVSDINVSIICSGEYSCVNIDVLLGNFSSFRLFCVEYSSCFDAFVQINNDFVSQSINDGFIECVALNACDNLLIDTSSEHTQLTMHQYSDNVAMDNGAGYLYNDQNVHCNTERFIQYETENNSTIDVEDLILNEYDSQLWPCTDVQIICGNNSCLMEYEVIEPQFLSDLQFETCYWLKVEYFLSTECTGQCLNSYAPTSAPTVPPTLPSAPPTIAPSFSPVQSPSFPPTYMPTNAPSSAPSNLPSHSPSSGTFHSFLFTDHGIYMN